jgi:hypothetical protein
LAGKRKLQLLPFHQTDGKSWSFRLPAKKLRTLLFIRLSR